MILFISKYLNNIDKKGRLSVPASVRAKLLAAEQGELVLYPSIKNQCIEGCGMRRLENMSKVIAALDPYSAERDAFEAVMLGESMQVSIDNEGRIMIPKFLNDHAAIDSQVIFIGKGDVFEIWNPELFTVYLENAKALAKASKNVLKNL